MTKAEKFKAMASAQNGMVPVRFSDGTEGMATGPQRDGTIAIQCGVKTTFQSLEGFDIDGGALIERT